MASARKVAVIGGGIGGLAAARALVRSEGSPDVTVFESSERPGGVLTTTTAEGYVLEHAANAFLSGSGDGAVTLCDALGVEVVEASPQAKRRWIFIDDALKELPTSPKAFARSDLLSTKAKLRMLAEPLIREQRPDGDESIYEFAARRLGDDVARAIVAPFVTGIFAGDARQVSLEAGFPTLAALRENGGIVRGMLGKVVGGRQKDGPKNKDPLRPRGRMFAPWQGVEALPNALAAELGDRLRYASPVGGISRNERGPIVEQVSGERESFDAVILATPAPVSAELLGGESVDKTSSMAAAARELAAIPYAPAIIVHLGYERAAIPHRLDGFGFLVAAGERLRVLGVVFESVLWANRAPRDRVLLRCIFGGARDPGVIKLSDEAIIEQARRDLDRTLGVRKAPSFSHVARWPRAIAQYEVGHAARIDRVESALNPRGIFLAGSAARAVAVTSIVSDATQVTSAVTAWLKGRPTASQGARAS